MDKVTLSPEAERLLTATGYGVGVFAPDAVHAGDRHEAERMAENVFRGTGASVIEYRGWVKRMAAALAKERAERAK